MGRVSGSPHDNRRMARKIHPSEKLYSGQRILLPTGNSVILGFSEAGEWECHWTDDSEHSGSVGFTDSFLRIHGRSVDAQSYGYSARADGSRGRAVPPPGPPKRQRG